MATVSETTSATTTSSTAKAPTGDILAFVEAFNKEFDKVIEELKVEINDAKLILASVSTITQLKQCSFPDGNPSVKTIGDLYKYSYNLDTGEDLSPKVKYFSGQIDPASVEIVSAFNKDIDGNTMVPKQDLKPFKSKILAGLNKSKSLKTKLELKTPQGKNPNLWSPGLYYFEYFHDEMKRYIKKEEEYGFGLDYLRALREGKETFTFSISSFTPDGDIIIKDSPFKAKGYGADDGQAGYSVFDSICQSKMENPYYTDMTFIARIGFQDNSQVFGNPSKPNNTPFQSLKTLYLSGKLEDLKTNPKFQQTRGEISDDGTFFYGNWEVMSLYKAFIQAGDNYEYVTFPFKKEEEPKKLDTATPSTVTQTTTAAPPKADEPKFIFNVEDEKTFFCKAPLMELHLIPSTNDVPQPLTYRTEEISDEEILDEEYFELEERNGEDIFTEQERAENKKFAENNKVIEKETKVEPVKELDKDLTTTTTTTLYISSGPSNEYSVPSLPENSIDKNSSLSNVPYYNQFDTRWGNQLYGPVTLEGGELYYWENTNFANEYTVKSAKEHTGKITGTNDSKEGKNWAAIVESAGNSGLSTIADAGCGITSLSMIINYWAIKINEKQPGKGIFTNPVKMGKLAVYNGGRPGRFKNKYTVFEKNDKGEEIKLSNQKCDGTQPGSILDKIEQVFGIKGSGCRLKDVDTELSNGRPVLWLQSEKPIYEPPQDTWPDKKKPADAIKVSKLPGCFKSNSDKKVYGGHFMVIASKGKFGGKDAYIVNDPGNGPSARIVYINDLSELNIDCSNTFWKFSYVEPKSV